MFLFTFKDYQTFVSQYGTMNVSIKNSKKKDLIKIN